MTRGQGEAEGRDGATTRGQRGQHGRTGWDRQGEVVEQGGCQAGQPPKHPTAPRAVARARGVPRGLMGNSYAEGLRAKAKQSVQRNSGRKILKGRGDEGGHLGHSRAFFACRSASLCRSRGCASSPAGCRGRKWSLLT